MSSVMFFSCIHFILDPLLTKDHPESYGFIKRLSENLKRTKNAEKANDTQKNEVSSCG